MKKLFLFFFTILITLTLLFTWNSCTESVVESTSESNLNDVLSLEKKHKEIDTLIPPPGDKAFPCDIRVEETWEFHHYETNTGRVLLVWPEAGADLLEYKTYWGFNGIILNLVQSAYDYVKNTCGYPEENIVAKIDWSKSVSAIKNDISNIYSKVYYLDEPLDQYRFTKYEILEIANHITSLYPSSKLLLGSFNNPNGWYTPYVESFGHAYNYILNNNTNTFMMCDKYYGDQRFMWEQYKNYYGNSKIYGHYIHSRRDHGDYDELLSKANSLGISKICYYHGSDGWPGRTDEFCEEAFQKGFLSKYGRIVTRYYRCLEGDCAQCLEGGK